MASPNPAAIPTIEESSHGSTPQQPSVQPIVIPASTLSMDNQTLQITQHKMNGLSL